MYTQCPHCRASYAPTASELALARGSVRCGHCGRVFSALERLADEPGPEDEVWPTHFKRELPPVLGMPDPLKSDDEPDEFIAPEPHVHVGLVGLPLEELPEQPVDAPIPSSWALRLLTVAMFLVAVVQLGYLMQARWRANPELDQWIAPIYQFLGVKLAPIAEPDAFIMGSRTVEPHPAIPGALLIRATLRHERPITLSYPSLELALSDLKGQRVAQRRFAPREYLPAGTDPELGLASRLVIPIELELRDPGGDANAFEFDFR